MTSGYREFRTQEGAFEFFNKFSPTVQKSKIILACDLDFHGTFHKDDKGCKKYAVIDYGAMLFYMGSVDPIYRCYYELIRPYTPTKLYFDIDGQCNERNNEKIELIKQNFHKDFCEFWDRLIVANEFGCKVLKTTHETADPTSSYIMNVYSSSNTTKFSQHVIFPNIVMENNFHAGAVFRRMELFLLEKYGENLDDNPYYLYKKKADTEDEYEIDFAPDRGVYTTKRVMRLIFNTKAAQKRFLMPLHVSSYDVTTNQYTTTQFRDIPGKTPDVLMFESYLQWFGPSTGTPHYYSCCEVRSWAVNELQTLTDDSFDPSVEFYWLEPESIGNKVVSISIQRLSRMRFTKYISKAGCNNNIGNDRVMTSSIVNHLSDTSLSDNPFMDEDSFRSSGIRVIETDIRKMKTIISTAALHEYENDAFTVFRLHQRDKKRDDKITKSKEIMIKSAQRYIMTRCAPQWWPPNSSIVFSDMTDVKTINLKSGRLYVYPSRFKVCQFKCFTQHKSNNVYFAIYCNPCIGNVGFLQKCLDPDGSLGHPLPISKKLHEPHRNRLEEELFNNVQASMKKFTISFMKSCYPLTHIGEERTISSWVLVSIVNVIVSHFITVQTTNLFSMFNRITNTSNVIQSVERLNNHVIYFIDLGKSNAIERTFIPRLVDEAIVQAAIAMGPEKGDVIIEKYAAYRGRCVVYSLMNILANNNYNQLSESAFVGVMRDLGVAMEYQHEITYNQRKNNSIVHINRMAALTEARIFRSYDSYINGKPIPPEDVEKLDTQGFIIEIAPKLSNLFSQIFQHI